MQIGITMPPATSCPEPTDSGGGGSDTGSGLQMVCLPGNFYNGGYYHNRFIVYVKGADSDLTVDWTTSPTPEVAGDYFLGFPDDRVDASYFKGPTICGGYFGTTAPLTLTISAKHDGVDLGDDLILEFPTACTTGPDPTT
jgi:hypothetical protein